MRHNRPQTSRDVCIFCSWPTTAVVFFLFLLIHFKYYHYWHSPSEQEWFKTGFLTATYSFTNVFWWCSVWVSQYELRPNLINDRKCFVRGASFTLKRYTTGTGKRLKNRWIRPVVLNLFRWRKIMKKKNIWSHTTY